MHSLKLIAYSLEFYKVNYTLYYFSIKVYRSKIISAAVKKKYTIPK